MIFAYLTIGIHWLSVVVKLMHDGSCVKVSESSSRRNRATEQVCNHTCSVQAFILKAASFNCGRVSVFLSVLTSMLSLVCAQLSRLQLDAEVHAPLNRPHPHLSIDGENRAAAMDAVGVERLSS